MSKKEFLELMDELLELGSGTLQGPEELQALENWDSLSIVSFMGLARTRAKAAVSPKQIAACKTVDDLFRLVSVEG